MASDTGMTKEDRVIYDPEVSRLIDEAMSKLAKVPGVAPLEPFRMRAVLETLVWLTVEIYQ